MEYKLLRKDDCDKSFKLENTRILCYSKSKPKDVSPNAKIIGEVILKNGKKPKDKKEHIKEDKAPVPTLIMAGKEFCIKDPGSSGKTAYRTKGYVAVGEDEYIRILESRKMFLLILAIMFLIAVGAISIILLLPKTPAPPPVELENPLPEIDPFAMIDHESDQDKPRDDIPQGGGSVNITFRPTASLDLETGEIDMSFTNPKSSSHAAVLEMYVVYTDKDGQKKELLIATSGLIPAGNKLETMQLDPDLKSIFSGEGKYNAKYRLLYYDQNSGVQSIVDAEFNEVVLKVRGK